MGDISLPDVSKLNDLKDDQIEALIEKLAEVQAHAPQIIAALEAQQEARSRGSRSTGSHDRHHRQQRTQPPNRGGRNGTGTAASNSSPSRKHRPQQEEILYEAEEEYEDEDEGEEEDDDDEDDDEDDDDFDEDAEYPMVGDGYSDELSVVSEMSCPTVVSSMEINEEEYYRDMVIGGMKVNAPKKKDLLSSVGRATARKSPGMATGVGKKKSPMMNGAAAGAEVGMKKASRPSTRQDKVASSGMKKKKPKDGISSGKTTPTGTKKIKKKTVKKGAINNGGWDAGASSSSFASKKSRGPQEKKSEPVMIDDDGFLVDQSAFETFDSASNPFSTAPSFDTGGNGGGDDFGDFAGFGVAAPAPKKSSKTKKLNVASTGKKKNSSSASAAGHSPKPSKRKGRRASVGGL